MQSTSTSRFPKPSGHGQGKNYHNNEKISEKNNTYKQRNNSRFHKRQEEKFNSKDGFTVVNNSRYGKKNNKHHNSHFYETKNKDTCITTKVRFTKPKKPVYKKEFPSLDKTDNKPVVRKPETNITNNIYSVLSNLEQYESSERSKHVPKNVPKPQGVWAKKISHAEHLKKCHAKSARKIFCEEEDKRKKLMEKMKKNLEKTEIPNIISYHSNVHTLNAHYYSGSDSDTEYNRKYDSHDEEFDSDDDDDYY